MNDASVAVLRVLPDFYIYIKKVLKVTSNERRQEDDSLQSAEP